jgi:hypothetical protein
MTVLNGGVSDFQIGNQTKEEVYELCLVTVKYGDVVLMKVFLGELLQRDAEELSMKVVWKVFATAEKASSLRRHSLLVALKDAMSGYRGDNDTLRCIGKNCFEMHPLLITAESLLKGTKYESGLLEGTKYESSLLKGAEYESSEYLAQRDNVETGTIDNECLVSQGDTEVESAGCDDEGVQDERLVEFLRSFADKKTVFVTVGYKISETEAGERSDSDLCCAMIEGGTLLEKDAQGILGYLDALEIKDALPPFLASEDDWDETYILKDGVWELYKGEMGEKAFYLRCEFFSGIKDCRL